MTAPARIRAARRLADLLDQIEGHAGLANLPKSDPIEIFSEVAALVQEGLVQTGVEESVFVGVGEDDRFQRGDAFVLDAPESVEAVWGDGEAVAWPKGEAAWIVAPAGTGKTTIAAQLARARLGCQEDVLGMPVGTGAGKVLYLAMDRPRQIARALRRNFSEADREMLKERLDVWAGPPPFDIGTDPDRLATFALGRNADTLIIDSAKDIAMDLSKDETGSRFNRAIQTALAAGVEVLVLHHQRKASAQNPKPRKLADVYGSTWLTAGAGSVLLLWGEPGDPIVELRTLKPAVGEIGPFMVAHDHEAGTSTVHERPDLLELAKRAPSGITAAEAAISVYGDSATKADRERTRRRLKALERRELLVSSGDGDAVRFRAVYPRVADRVPHTKPHTNGTAPLDNAARTPTRQDTAPSGSTVTPLRGDVCEGVQLEEETAA